ncbi:hypothetical protein [Roseateles violae]|uniref:Uncharacterized protein n=1 Tax=Roseateles violae TaxID=3058042 RepID=A0ABT8DTX6_9BURK|nr:hypothetical protein [Pelomonas sp. PFR6]MDN3921531.1 hypothetical protein [Pelomonas sp. PFR6]
MKPWKQALDDAALSGGLASALSTLVLAWRGRRDAGSGAAPLNAPAHWLWSRALGQDRSSLRYTVLGMVVHHLSSVFWAFFYEKASPAQARPDARQALRTAAAVTTLAAVVDLKLVPERLTPGFERRIDVSSLLLVYAAFASGLALGSLLRGPRGAIVHRDTALAAQGHASDAQAVARGGRRLP